VPGAVVFAPAGRDATVAATLLRGAGIAASICADLAALERSLGDDAGFVVVTEEALRDEDLRGLIARLNAQPAWSDLPFIVLTRRGGASTRSPYGARLEELLGNVTLLERPFHPLTFISVARVAVKARERQLEARARIEELREGEQRLQTALLVGRLGSWELNVATGALRASPTFAAIMGLDPREALTRQRLLDAVHRDDRERAGRALDRAAASGADYAIEHRVEWPDGSLHWADVRARVVHWRADDARLVGVASDITDRKRAERALIEVNETLEERVAARTRELQDAHAAVLAEIEQRKRAEDELRQAQKMETLGQLTGGVAHDFNNLLMAIIGNLDLLRRRFAGDQEAMRYVEGALQGAQRGAALTQRLLMFARRQDLVTEPCDLSALVRGMSDLIERSVGAQIEVRLELPARAPLVMLDTNQIELAILNLVVNARDAMPGGGVLTIGVEAVESAAQGGLAAGAYVRLFVADTGHGMDEETMRKAVEPFFSTKEVGKGTGLGLSMIHGLAIQLHGALRLASEVGRGTRAEIWLPVTDQAAISPEAVPAVASGTPSRRLTVLLVDDDELIAHSTANMLEDLGHAVIPVPSGERALAVLERGEPIDFVVTDYAMPGMNGVEFAERVRRLRPALPMLLVSGYAEIPRHASMDLPRLAKPYHQAQLAAEIERQLAARAPRGSDARGARGDAGMPSHQGVVHERNRHGRHSEPST
jgi:PAS domain S-box-containing protein